MLQILGRKTSSNVQKVLWCCEEIGSSFDRQDVGGEFGKNKTPEYLALNPNGLVPTINDDGFLLWNLIRVCAISPRNTARGSCGLRTCKSRRAPADGWIGNSQR